MISPWNTFKRLERNCWCARAEWPNLWHRKVLRSEWSIGLYCFITIMEIWYLSLPQTKFVQCWIGVFKANCLLIIIKHCLSSWFYMYVLFRLNSSLWSNDFEEVFFVIVAGWILGIKERIGRVLREQQGLSFVKWVHIILSPFLYFIVYLFVKSLIVCWIHVYESYQLVDKSLRSISTYPSVLVTSP